MERVFQQAEEYPIERQFNTQRGRLTYCIEKIEAKACHLPQRGLVRTPKTGHGKLQTEPLKRLTGKLKSGRKKGIENTKAYPKRIDGNPCLDAGEAGPLGHRGKPSLLIRGPSASLRTSQSARRAQGRRQTENRQTLKRSRIEKRDYLLPT